MFQTGYGGGLSGFDLSRWYKSGCVSFISVESWNWGFGPRHQAVISVLLAARTPCVVRDVHVVSVRIEPGSVSRQGHARPLGHGQSSMVSFLVTLLSAVLTARTR